MTNKFNFVNRAGGGIIFCAFLLSSLLISSCDKEEKISNASAKATLITKSEYDKKRVSQVQIAGKTFTVEHCTLDELNKLMREAGLPEYTKRRNHQIITD